MKFAIRRVLIMVLLGMGVSFWVYFYWNQTTEIINIPDSSEIIEVEEIENLGTFDYLFSISEDNLLTLMSKSETFMLVVDDVGDFSNIVDDYLKENVDLLIYQLDINSISRDDVNSMISSSSQSTYPSFLFFEDGIVDFAVVDIPLHMNIEELIHIREDNNFGITIINGDRVTEYLAQLGYILSEDPNSDDFVYIKSDNSDGNVFYSIILEQGIISYYNDSYDFTLDDAVYGVNSMCQNFEGTSDEFYFNYNFISKLSNLTLCGMTYTAKFESVNEGVGVDVINEFNTIMDYLLNNNLISY